MLQKNSMSTQTHYLKDDKMCAYAQCQKLTPTNTYIRLSSSLQFSSKGSTYLNAMLMPSCFSKKKKKRNTMYVYITNACINYFTLIHVFELQTNMTILLRFAFFIQHCI